MLSDSRAALISSLTSERVTSPFHDVRTLLLSLHNQVQLFWIAGHRGHLGNEIADLLAKQGALGPGTFTDALLPPMSSFRLKVRQSVREMWASKWAESSKASATRAFFPTISSTKSIMDLDLPIQVVQLLTGHCRLRSYLFKIACAPPQLVSVAPTMSPLSTSFSIAIISTLHVASSKKYLCIYVNYGRPPYVILSVLNHCAQRLLHSF
jgi:hypothetical protein